MLKVISPETMRGIDAHAISTGISSYQLMEQAAESAFDRMLVLLPELGFLGKDDVLVMCGTGNNGGDGLVIARLLSELSDEVAVHVCVVGDQEAMTPETEQNFVALQFCDVTMVDFEAVTSEQLHFDIVVDALLGIGTTLPLRGPIRDAASFVQQSGSRVVSIDIPTGVCAATGDVDDCAVVADITCTMEAVKTGMLLGEAPDYCGHVEVCPIGAPASAWNDVNYSLMLENKDIRDILPERKRQSSKRTFGHVVVLAGSSNMPGAAALSANACITAGAGTVTLITPKVHASVLPDIMTVELESENGFFTSNMFDEVEADLAAATAVVVGPGLGSHPQTQAFVARVLQWSLETQKPVVVDADGLRAVSQHTRLHNKCILTPHEGEFARLTGHSIQEIEQQRDILAQQWASQLHCTLVLKSSVTRIANGTLLGWNTSGTPALATAGSGDVLAGVLGALVAQGISAFEAAMLATHWHGLAGQFISESEVVESATASKVIRSLGPSLLQATGGLM